MKILLSLLLSISSILLMSCSQNSNEVRYKCNLKLSMTSLSIKLPESATPTTYVIRFMDNNQKILAWKNGKNSNVIYLYDIEKEEYLKKMVIQKEGPDGIGNLFGFDIINLDTILVTSMNFNSKIFLIDTSARIKEKIDFSDLMQHEYFVGISWLTTLLNTNISLKNNELNIGAIVTGFNSKSNELDKLEIGYNYSFRTQKYSKLKILFPSMDYSEIENIKPQIIFGNNNEIQLSFSAYDDIFISDGTEKLKAYNCKSKFRSKNFKSTGVQDIQESLKIGAKYPWYLGLTYDKYRNVYYRFFYPGIDVKKGDNLMSINEFKELFSIIILDKDFNVIGETLFPKNTYNPEMYYIDNKGLWLSTNHIQNPEFDPDFLKFSLFKLEQNK